MRDWLNSILGQDGGRIAQLALALIAVILLFLLLAWVARRLLPGGQLPTITGGKSRKRLGVLEASDVDARRRLVLVRRDDVEHLIMIGGPNDLLIESRILRGVQAGARPNVQQMPRPATAFEPERATPPLVAPTAAGAAATGPTPPAPSSVQLSAPTASPAPTPSRPLAVDELDLAVISPAPPTAPFAVQFPTAGLGNTSTGQAPTAPPPFMPPMRGPTATVATPAPSPAAVEPRRPSMNDILNAAAAAKASDPRAAVQPVMAPPPLPRARIASPDLEEDDREMPTQIVSHRPSQTLVAPLTPAPEPAAERDAPGSRETEVANKIERALADLNPLGLPPEPARQPRVEPVPAQAPSFRRPAPAPQPLQPVPAPMPAAAAPTLPPIPPRPVPTMRPALVDRPPQAERPPLVERAYLTERPPFAARPSLPERTDTQPASTAYPVPPYEPEPHTNERQTAQVTHFPPLVTSQSNTQPVTAPRPTTGPIPRPPVAAVEPPPPAAQPVATTNKQKSDELEEEMAKLLSELGGSSSR